LYRGSNATFLKDKIHTLCKQVANDSRADALTVELSVPRAPEASPLGTDRMAIGLAGKIVDRVVEIGDVHSHQAEGLVTMVARLMRILNEQTAFSGWERIAQAYSSKSILLSTDKGGLLDVYWQTLTDVSTA
jgi:hypothetical protein